MSVEETNNEWINLQTHEYFWNEYRIILYTEVNNPKFLLVEL